jgi:co-chaperonin GroES (HSP10)
VGDGRTFKTGLTADTHSLEKEDIFLKINDIVIFQLPPMMVASMTYQIGDKGYLFIHQADCIARLSNTKAAIENLEILGHFVLASRKRTRVTTGGILLPDVVEDFNDDMNHFHAIQVGGLVNKCKVGDKLILDRTRANKISLTGDEYFYVDQNAIHGVIEDEG